MLLAQDGHGSLPSDTSSLPSGYLYKVEQLQPEMWDVSTEGHERSSSVPWLLLHLGHKLEMAAPSSQERSGFDIAALPHTLTACRGSSQPHPAPEGDSSVPYRGLLLLRVGIALIICAERGVSEGPARAQLSHHQQDHQPFFQGHGSP